VNYKVHIINITVWRCIYMLRSRLRHWATSKKVEGSTPTGVTRIFHRMNPAGHTMDLGPAHPLAEMISWGISWEGVKVASA
jgi:hypothetical protein